MCRRRNFSKFRHEGEAGRLLPAAMPPWPGKSRMEPLKRPGGAPGGGFGECRGGCHIRLEKTHAGLSVGMREITEWPGARSSALGAFFGALLLQGLGGGLLGFLLCVLTFAHNGNPPFLKLNLR